MAKRAPVAHQPQRRIVIDFQGRLFRWFAARIQQFRFGNDPVPDVMNQRIRCKQVNTAPAEQR